MSAETKHSPEPWVYWDNGFDAGIVSEQDVANAHAKSVCPSIIFGGEPCEGRVEADDPNVRRTIACVNALAGIPTEALEAGRLGEALDLLAEWVKYANHASVGPACGCGTCRTVRALRALGRLP
jgi:hypothetical protein